MYIYLSAAIRTQALSQPEICPGGAVGTTGLGTTDGTGAIGAAGAQTAPGKTGMLDMRKDIGLRAGRHRRGPSVMGAGGRTTGHRTTGHGPLRGNTVTRTAQPGQGTAGRTVRVLHALMNKRKGKLKLTQGNTRPL